MRLILGSASPRRRELLDQIGITPDLITAPDIDEAPRPAEQPQDYCRRIAAEKSMAIDLTPGDLLLTADTTVALGRRILGKPETEDEAAAFLRLMSGRRHRVITAVAVRDQQTLRQRENISVVRMRPLLQTDIDRYIASGEWRGKAGGYAIQGLAAGFIPWISGSYSGIMGLPLAETMSLLASFEYGK